MHSYNFKKNNIKCKIVIHNVSRETFIKKIKLYLNKKS